MKKSEDLNTFNVLSKIKFGEKVGEETKSRIEVFQKKKKKILRWNFETKNSIFPSASREDQVLDYKIQIKRGNIMN